MSGIIKNSRNTENAPKSEFSTQTVAFSHYNNISAQLPVDAKTGAIVAGGVKEQAAQCLANIKAIVESIDHVMTDVIRINVFLKNIMDIDAVNEVYASFFPSYLPTQTVLAVNELPLEGALVQMDAVISNGEGSGDQAPCDLFIMSRDTDAAPKSRVSTHNAAFSHYAHVSAQLPIDPKTGNVAVGGAHEQAMQCLRNIKGILETTEVPLDDIVKVNIHVKNLSDVAAVNEAYTRFFPDSAIARTVGYMPARNVIKAEGLPMDALVQMDATVSYGDGTPNQAVEDRHGLVIEPNNTEAAPVSKLSTQTVAFSHYNNISGQLPVDAKTGAIVAGGVKEQAAQCLSNIKAIIESVEHSMNDIVKINIQVKNIADIDAINEVYPTFFPGDLPARTVIGVSEIAEGALVAMDAIAGNCEGTAPKAQKLAIV